MKKALIVTALVGTLGVSGIIGYAASNASQLTTGVKSAVTAQTTTMTVDEAQKIALQKVKGSIISSEQDDDDYEFDIRDGDYVYEVEVKKNNGNATTVEKDYKPAHDVTVSEEQAREIALKKVPDGEIVKLELDDDDGQSRYDVEIVKHDYEHELEIDATTGKILEYERDTQDE
ncbi:PepSY domain-containing protein [Kurthia huakuii]|uniref:PepSY domain-containing protein n=1 Tax=Kurthia huakuii TaxID=1421019 RepID=UPI0004957928|nr:PepSY domain-containing protein [Kurthia huakuii]MBM7700320.1 putative membrane protein YkoI [Kurthia huakuii]